MECNNNGANIQVMYIMNASDVKFDDKGTTMIGMKRKYGKFKRPVTKIEFDGNQTTKG